MKPLIAIFVGAVASHTLAALPEDILRTAWKDNRIELHDRAVNAAVDAHSYNFLDKADFRYDLGEFDQDDVQYSMRFYPKGWTELRTTVEFQEVLEKNEKTSQAAALSELLAARYDVLARIALLKEKKQIADELQKVSRKSNRILSLGAQKNRADLKSYLKNKSDLDKFDIKITDVERDYQNLQAELKELSLGDVESFDLNDFASMDVLKERIEKEADEKPATTLSSRLAQLDLEKSRAGMAYEKAKDTKWFDHLEISVKDDRKEDQHVYGLELAFNLPFLSAPNLSRIDKEMRDLRDNAKMLSTVEASDRNFKNGLMELKTLLQVHKSLSQTKAYMNIDQMRKASRTIAPRDPQLAIELQRGWFENREQMLDLEFRIRSLYILYLHEASIIANSPDKNYLSKTHKRIL